MPVLDNFEVLNFEQFNPSEGQTSISFEKTKITISQSSISILSDESPVSENISQEISDIYLQDENDQRKIFYLLAADESKMLLITAGIATQEEIDRPFLIIFYDEIMTTGIKFSLSRIH